jgi:thiamine pyrophosphate-dependent acetolactate synthase large subunit-like protein
VKLYAALARGLADHGVDTVFGLLADPTMLFADSFVRSEGGTFVSATHEAGATHMGYGYQAISRRLGVVCVDHGPGLMNSLTAVVDAVKARAPMLLIYPDTAVEEKHYRQNVPQRDLLLPTGAGFEPVRSPRTVLEDLAVAIRRAQFERRPVALNVPREYMAADVDYQRLVLDPVSMPKPAVDGESLDRAVGIIATARRPVVLVGRGAVAARAELLCLAERIGAPLATTLGGKDLFRGEPFDLGIMGTLSHGTALDIVAEADCIISFGAGLNQDTTVKGSMLTGKRVVRCDIDPERLTAFANCNAMILGDAAEVAATVVDWLDTGDIPTSAFRTPKMAERLAAQAAHRPTPAPTAPGTVDFRTAIRAIDELVPRDRIYVNDIGRHITVTWPEVHVQSPHDFVLTGHVGAIGTGMGIAVGAGCADRSRPVLMVGGDGGFMLGGMGDFNSAVRHGIDLIAVICNDGAYGPEHQKFVEWGMPPSLVEFDWPDLGQVAEALGGVGITVRNEEDLSAARKLVGERSRPVLIELKLDPYQMPDVPH